MTSPAPTPAVRLPITGGWQLTVKYNQGGQEAANVVGFSGTGLDASLTTCQAVLQAYWTVWRDVVVSSVTCTGGTMRNVGPGDEEVYELAAPTNPAGANPGESTIAAASYLVKWQTAQGGRSGKGRTYFPGLPESAVGADGRTIQPSNVTALNTIIASYLSTAFGGGNWKPSVLSFTKGQAYVITGGALAPRAALQSRRMR